MLEFETRNETKDFAELWVDCENMTITEVQQFYDQGFEVVGVINTQNHGVVVLTKKIKPMRDF